MNHIICEKRIWTDIKQMHTHDFGHFIFPLKGVVAIETKHQSVTINISAEDGTRTQNSRLEKFAQMGKELNVDRICISDTVGVGTPEIMTEKVKCILGACDIPVAVHCHNDFGLAAINSIAAVKAGATHLAVTINGLGERCGNASLEQCALILTKLYGYEINITLSKILNISKFIANAVLIPLEPTIPVVGRNCFCHESGIHVAAMLKNPECYEPYNPKLVGGKRKISLGKTNGKAAIQYLANAIGEKLTDDECLKVLIKIHKLEDSCDVSQYGVLKGVIDQCKIRI